MLASINGQTSCRVAEKLWQILEEAVCSSSETDRQSEERKEKWEEVEEKDYSASKRWTWLLTPPHQQRIFLYFILPFHWTGKLTWLWPFYCPTSGIKTFFWFCTPSIYCFFLEQYVYISHWRDMCRIIIALPAIISMKWLARMWTVRCSINSPLSLQVVTIFSGQLCLLHNRILAWTILTCLCILFNSTCMYIMYIIDVSVCVNELVFPSIYSVLVDHGYINANISPWWVVTQLNILLTTKQSNKSEQGI